MDLAYDQKFGHIVRKSYQRYVRKHYNEGTNLFDYKEGEKNCKYCSEKRSSIVYMFDHIKEKHLDGPPKKSGHQAEKMTLVQGESLAQQRLLSCSFTKSPTQESTPKDGNCFIWSILDQMSYYEEFQAILTCITFVN